MSSSIRRLILVGAGLLCAALFVEGILSFTDSYAYDALAYDSRTGLIRYEPNTTYPSKGACYNFDASINRLGFYGPDIAPDTAPGTTRIIIVGSSFVEGIQVPLSERFDTILEERLNREASGRYDVIALGFPANGTYLNMLYYKEYMQELNPDIVINLMTDFDLGKDAATTASPPRFDEAGHAILELPPAKRNEVVIAIKETARKSRLFEALYERYMTLRAVVNEKLYPETVTTQSDERKNFAATWETEAALFRDFKRLVEEDTSARFVVASWTTAGHDDRDFVGRELRSITKSAGIPYLDLAPVLDEKEAATGKSAILPCGGHWGADGHLWVADALSEYLRSSKILR